MLKIQPWTQERTAAGRRHLWRVTDGPPCPPCVCAAGRRAPGEHHPALRQHFSWSRGPAAGLWGRAWHAGISGRLVSCKSPCLSCLFPTQAFCSAICLRTGPRPYIRDALSGVQGTRAQTPSTLGPRAQIRVCSEDAPRFSLRGPAQRPSLSAGGSREGGGVGPAQTPTGVRKWLLRAVQLF